MKPKKIKSFSELTSTGLQRAIGELLKRSESPNLGLLFYKLLPFEFETSQLEKGVKSQEAGEKFILLLQRIKNYRVKVPAFACDKSFTLKTAYRLVAGMGYPSLLENGFLFHHTYGIPYIPGETLKGLARHVLMLSIYEALEKSPELTLSDLEKFLLNKEEDFRRHSLYRRLEGLEVQVVLSDPPLTVKDPHLLFRRLFGTQERRGEVVFYDAFPVNFSPSDLELDIMNPHYAGYYQSKGQKPPADWENPVPVKFLVLKKGVPFRFCLRYVPLGRKEPQLLEYAYALLQTGLLNFGVGGKKAKGYGWFEP